MHFKNAINDKNSRTKSVEMVYIMPLSIFPSFQDQTCLFLLMRLLLKLAQDLFSLKLDFPLRIS